MVMVFQVSKALTVSNITAFTVKQVWLKPSCKAQCKGAEDKADRGRGGKTTSGNGQGKWRKLVAKSSVLLQQPSRFRNR